MKWRAHRTREHAAVFLGGLRKMKVGLTEGEEVRRLAAKSQGWIRLGQPTCFPAEWCTYTFSYGTYFSSCWFLTHLDVHRDLLVRTTMGMFCDGVSATVSDEVPAVSPSPELTYCRVQATQILVYIKPGATPAQRAGAYTFNLECLEKTCGDVSVLLPEARS